MLTTVPVTTVGRERRPAHDARHAHQTFRGQDQNCAHYEARDALIRCFFMMLLIETFADWCD